MKFRKVTLILFIGIFFVLNIPNIQQPLILPKSQSDNSISENYLYHNTRNEYYRTPGYGSTHGYNKSGAVPVETDVTIRFRTLQDDVTEVNLVTEGEYPTFQTSVSMSIYESQDNYDYWSASFPSQTAPNECEYYFEVIDGTLTKYYVEDVIADNYGGVGTPSSIPSQGFPIIFYENNFSTPFWHRNLTVGYQIFIDRFYNGDPLNDAIGNGSSGDLLWHEWDRNGNGVIDGLDGMDIYATKREWGDIPPNNWDFYGGDLQGVLEKIDYLADELGVEMIWFNPFMEGPDNHGYSVDNYYALDPYFGVISNRSNGVVINNVTAGLDFFEDFADELETRNIKIIADMVLNHVSAQSVYFQRFENTNVTDNPTGFNVPDSYPFIDGAYENQSSEYYDWFHFNEFNHDYDTFADYDHIPALKYYQTPEIEEELITGMNSVFTFWSDLGVDGFRLDVNQDYQDGEGARYVNSIIRQKVKSDNPENVIIGEVWDSNMGPRFHQGNMLDGMQNQDFMWKTRNFLHRNLGAESYTNFLIYMQETYPPEAFHSLWSILGTHDTTRIFTDLFADFAEFQSAIVLQMTLPGVPMIYYGDEIGMHGGPDPQNRAAYKWDTEDQNHDVLNFYKSMIGLRKDYNSLRLGGFTILDNSDSRIVSYARNTNNLDDEVIIVAVNKYGSSYDFDVYLEDLPFYSKGDVLTDFSTGIEYSVDRNGVLSLNLAPDSFKILIGKLSVSKKIPGTPVYLFLLSSMFGLCLLVAKTKIKHNY